MFDFSLHNIFHSNIINFFVMLAIIVFILYKLKLTSKIDTAHKNAIKEVENSNERKVNSINELNKTKEDFSHLPEVLGEIEANAKKMIEETDTKLKTDISKIEENFKSQAQRIMNSNIKAANEQTKQKMTKTAVETAKEKLKNNLKTSPELHRKFIAQAIDEIGEL